MVCQSMLTFLRSPMRYGLCEAISKNYVDLLLRNKNKETRTGKTQYAQECLLGGDSPTYTPIVYEHFGCWGEKAITFLKRLRQIHGMVEVNQCSRFPVLLDSKNDHSSSTVQCVSHCKKVEKLPQSNIEKSTGKPSLLGLPAFLFYAFVAVIIASSCLCMVSFNKNPSINQVHL